VLDHFWHTERRLFGITADNASSNYSMTGDLQSTHEASEIEQGALRTHIPSMAHSVQLAVGVSISSLCENGRTKSWEAHGHNQQGRENESIDIWKTQSLRIKGNARINEWLVIRPGAAQTIEKVHISRYIESPATDIHIAENVCCIDYKDTLASKQFS
jgi:hypothetical protein